MTDTLEPLPIRTNSISISSRGDDACGTRTTSRAELADALGSSDRFMGSPAIRAGFSGWLL